MAPQLNNSQTFSACSIQQIQPTLNSASCLTNLQPAGREHRRQRAESVRDDQCRALRVVHSPAPEVTMHR